MYRISELAALVGLSRTALLYYEKLGLISGRRLANGYRVYDDRDVQQVRLVQQLQNGGLTLAECKSCLESQLDMSVLHLRYAALENDIAKKQQSLALLKGLLGKASNKSWHETLADIAPDAHLDWLKLQGYDEKQALRIKWLSKDMNKHEKYMQDFLSIFDALESWGPNSEADTSRAFGYLKEPPERILEVGCGNGQSTMLLARLSNAKVTAIDNEQSALNRLETKIHRNRLSERVSTLCVSMTELNFENDSFDLIWAEASIYIMGVQMALSKWKPLLNKNGVMVFSDLVWLSDSPDKESVDFWKGEYPDMQDVDTRLTQIQNAGYEVENTFTVSEQAWRDYYEPLQSRLKEVKSVMQASQAFSDIQREVNLIKEHLGEFGYQFFIARKC